MQQAPRSRRAPPTPSGPSPPSTRAIRDRELLVHIRRVHERNFGVYAKKIRAQLRRVGVRFARCIVERLVREERLRGIRRKKGSQNALPDDGPSTRLYLVERDFTEKVANQLRVADITCSRAFAGWICAALVIDLFSRRAVGWQLSKSLRTALALYALEMGPWSREYAGRDVFGLSHDSDEGVHHVATRYTQRLAEAGAVASVGSTGDSYGYALAEVFDSLLKAELVRNCGPWRSIDELEIATAEYIDWFIHRWLHGEIGMIPPVELEDTYLHYQAVPATADAALASL
ncbi:MULTISPECIES: IS3 family transposase [Brachybacterium]|uniref:IS3 family transposase n=1 Tax=Brachybacterium paraconglomeratum TaxID=173362 RepID=A0A3R8QT14_9MICO|nr:MULTISPECIES: IS3 family transposase [Brachybacterium]RRR17907.1 IS3 family transposase [Brachybacterium paraconglomeratum]